VALGHMTQFRNVGTLITFERIELSASSLAHIIEDGQFLQRNPKITHNWAWPGSRDPISKCWDTASNLVKIWRTYPHCDGRVEHKRPLNGRGRGHMTQF